MGNSIKSAKFLIIISVFFYYSQLSFSQKQKTLTTERITSENIKLERGLSQNNVKCIIQDQNGYLWFGTWDGLNKYDGYTFTVFKPNLSDRSKGISHQTINCIYEDSEGFIWVGTDKGLNKFDRKSQKFTQYKNTSVDSNNLINDTIRSIIEDQLGIIWIGTNNGLNKYDKQTGGIINIKHNPDESNSLIHNKINKLYCDRQGYIWIATSKGLDKYDPITNNFIRYFNQTNLKNFNFNINSIIEDRQANIWLATSKGLIKIENETGETTIYKADNSRFGLKSNEVTAIYEDWFDQLWIGTQSGGLSILDLSENKFINYATNMGDISNLQTDIVTSIYEDASGIIWVGTEWKGVIKIDRNSYRFRHFYNSSNDNKSLNAQIVWSIFEDDDKKLWIGTDNGINIYNPKTATFSYIQSDPNDQNSLSSNQIRDVFKDKNGNYWIGTFDAGLNFYNPKTKKYIHYHHNIKDPKSLSDNCVWKILQDSYGIIWIGTNNGLCQYIPEKDHFKVYAYNADNENGITNNSIFSIYEDSHKNVWFCTYDGLIKYNREKDNFISFKHEESNPNSLTVSSVFSIFEDIHSGTYWIATMGGGLNHYFPDDNIFEHYTEDDGLANNIVYRIFSDKFGNLWISTNHGICKFNVDDKTFINYDVKDGIQSYEYNHNAAFMGSDGTIYFGGMNGFNAFNPAEIKINQNIPPIIISKFEILNKPMNRELNNGDTIYLSYKENFFSFEFASLDFTNPLKNKYQYRLKNYNNKWIATDAEKRFANFTKVNPGHYIFQVKGSNSEGYWNDKGISINIIIKPPWWNTWLFRILAFICVAANIYYAISSYYRRLRRKHNYEKKILTMQKEFSEIQQKALRLQMNPHFIFNSLNSIQHFILEQDDESAHIYLANFSALMRKTLENSKYNTITLHEEIATLKLYLELEKLRFSNHFEYNINVHHDINTNMVNIPPMLIQPYLENAIWHGLMPKKSPGKLNIIIEKYKNKGILIKIIDDGIGRKKADEIRQKRKGHKSTGMKNIEERIQLLNDLNQSNMSVKIIDLYDDNQQPTGTEINLIISHNKDM